MSGESQIIVGSEIDNLLAVEGADRGLLVVEHAQFEVRAFGFEFVELVGQVRKGVGAGCRGHGSLTKLSAADSRGSTRMG